MNNSIIKKIDSQFKKINSNDLSSTSSDFFYDYNKKKYIKQNGGSCSCNDLFKSASNENFELILYILKQHTCCFKCQDKNGNTALHLLVTKYNSTSEIKNEIDELLSNTDSSEFLNIKNNQGQTPILLAVMNDENELAEKLEKAGADGSIEDNYGNFVESKNEEDIQTDSISEINIKSKPNKNLINIFNLFVQVPDGQDLTSLNLDKSTDRNSSDRKSTIDNISNSLNTDDFMQIIKSKIDNSLNKENSVKSPSSSSSTTSEYLELPETDSVKSKTMNTDNFVALLNNDSNKPPSFVNLSDVENTDDFILLLRNKYSSPNDSKTEKKNDSKKIENIVNDSTSPVESSVNTQMIKLENETTSESNVNNIVDSKSNVNNIIDSESNVNNIIDSESNQAQAHDNKILDEKKLKSKYNIFFKNKTSTNELKNISTSDIDTNTLLKAIKKIQLKYENNDENTSSDMILKGGATKQKVLGFRKLNSDSDQITKKTKTNSQTQYKKKYSSNIDYNLLYNSDSEFGSKSKVNELARMMSSQKDKIHQEVLAKIMNMLNEGLLLQDNKPIEANEKNAKLVKAYIYRQISEKNPQIGGMDKILLFKSMSDNEIIKMVKKMPNIDELEQTIQKHLEEKVENKSNKSKKDVDVSKTETTDSENSEKKETKKKSSKSKSK